MADKKPIGPKKPLKRSAKVARNPKINAVLAPNEPPVDLLQKAVGTWKISGLLVLLSGGIMAGGLGFFAATLLENFNSRDSLAPLLNAQSELYERVEIQAAQIETIKASTILKDPSVTIAALGVSVGELKVGIKKLWAAHAEEAKALSQRIDVLDKRPLTQGVSLEAIAAYERELDKLRADVSQMASDSANQITQAKAISKVLEADRLKPSGNGPASGSLNSIWRAVESGLSFEGPLADLVAATDLDVAPSLSENASMGVASLIVLQGKFAVAARTALKLARQESGPQEGESRILAFLKSQLGVRSLTAKDGASADAILSRALVAVDEGNLELALSEIVRLPDSSKAPLQPWSEAAGQRLRVLTALQKISNSLAGN